MTEQSNGVPEARKTKWSLSDRATYKDGDARILILARSLLQQ
jgi:hypothetical protein